MNSILYALFEDNPGLPEEVYRFCLARPAYRAADADRSEKIEDRR